MIGESQPLLLMTAGTLSTHQRTNNSRETNQDAFPNSCTSFSPPSSLTGTRNTMAPTTITTQSTTGSSTGTGGASTGSASESTYGTGSNNTLLQARYPQLHHQQPQSQQQQQQQQQSRTSTRISIIKWWSKSTTVVAVVVLCVTCILFFTVLATSVSTAITTNSEITTATAAMTEQERTTLQHYYGIPFMMMMTSTKNSIVPLLQQLRNAQLTADATIHELNDSGDTNDSNSVNNNETPEDEDRQQHESESDHPNLRGRKQQRLLHEENSHHHHHHCQKTPMGCETTIVLIRHCEKELIAEHCAYNGYERSVYISTLFGATATSSSHSNPNSAPTTTATARYPKPSYIFAESPISRNSHSHKMNFREVETVGPLAESLHIPIDDSYTDETLYELAHHLKTNIRSGTYCGQVIVVVWKHTRIAELAHMLGCGPLQGCPIDYSGKSFDQLWQVRYVYTNEFTHSTHKRHFLQHPYDTTNVDWKVFGSLQYENFDPLAFSTLRGDYNPSIGSDDQDDYHHDATTDSSNPKSWQDEVASYPERSYSTDTAGWQMTMVGLSHQSKNKKKKF